jgi:uncharacterized protein DUF2852
MTVLDLRRGESIYVNVNNIHTEGRSLDATGCDLGRVWEAGMDHSHDRRLHSLVARRPWRLAYLIWSGRMGCGNRMQWKNYFASEARKFGGGMTAFRSTGNRAFDDYREETLRRLEEEANEFQSFLQRLRHAKDKAEFDQFMSERRNSPATS